MWRLGHHRFTFANVPVHHGTTQRTHRDRILRAALIQINTIRLEISAHANHPYRQTHDRHASTSYVSVIHNSEQSEYQQAMRKKNCHRMVRRSEGRSQKLHSRRQFHGRSSTGSGNQNYNLIGDQIRESLVAWATYTPLQ